MPADYEVLRVNVRIDVIEELKAEATRETETKGRYTYVSDLVREAIRDLLRRRKNERESGIPTMRVFLGGQAREEG